MAAQDIAAALERVRTVLTRRPEAGIHDDAPATARWAGGLRIDAGHPSGASVATDMPTELGGSGDQVSPGWLFRAGLASCAATCIGLNAAAEGIELALLEVVARSRSDLRGLVGLPDAHGDPVPAASQDLGVSVRIAAHGVTPERLQALAERGLRGSPIYTALQPAVPMALHIEVVAA